MLSSALDIPFIEGGFFIPSLPCVIRTAWRPHKKYSPFLYVMRDCRDVMLSLVHHRIRNYKNTPKLNGLYRKRFGEDLSAEKIPEQLRGFIEVEFENNVSGSRMNWNRHVSAWLELADLDDSGKRYCVRYEDALGAPAETVGQIVHELLDVEISPKKLSLVQELHDKTLGHDRLSTTSDSTFLRKGIAGEWRSVFSRDAGEALAYYVNDALMLTGYETDRFWWRELSS